MKRSNSTSVDDAIAKTLHGHLRNVEGTLCTDHKCVHDMMPSSATPEHHPHSRTRSFVKSELMVGRVAKFPCLLRDRCGRSRTSHASTGL